MHNNEPDNLGKSIEPFTEEKLRKLASLTIADLGNQIADGIDHHIVPENTSVYAFLKYFLD